MVIPEPGEQLAPVGHHRPFDAQHQLMPASLGMPGWIKFVRDACPAGKHDALVDNQQLAVIAHQVGQPARKPQRVVKDQLDPAPDQPIPVALFQGQRAVSIEHHVHRDTAPGGLGQRSDETIGHLAGFKQVHAQADFFARLADGREHRRKKSVAIDEQLETVAFPPGIVKALPAR